MHCLHNPSVCWQQSNSHVMRCHLISSHLISSHLLSSHLISSHLISSHRISSRLISSHRIASHLISSHLVRFPNDFDKCLFKDLESSSVTCSEDLYVNKILIYRVSIKSFPDYKYLLQENYCTWKTNFFFFKFNSRSFFTTHQYTSACAPFGPRRTSNR